MLCLKYQCKGLEESGVTYWINLFAAQLHFPLVALKKIGLKGRRLESLDHFKNTMSDFQTLHVNEVCDGHLRLDFRSTAHATNLNMHAVHS